MHHFSRNLLRLITIHKSWNYIIVWENKRLKPSRFPSRDACNIHYTQTIYAFIKYSFLRFSPNNSSFLNFKQNPFSTVNFSVLFYFFFSLVFFFFILLLLFLLLFFTGFWLREATPLKKFWRQFRIWSKARYFVCDINKFGIVQIN